MLHRFLVKLLGSHLLTCETPTKENPLLLVMTRLCRPDAVRSWSILQWLLWLTPRESAPWQRLLTGALFGLFSAWFILPILRESMLETRFALEKKAVLALQSKANEGLA